MVFLTQYDELSKMSGHNRGLLQKTKILYSLFYSFAFFKQYIKYEK